MAERPRLVVTTDAGRLAAPDALDRIATLLDAGLTAVWLRAPGMDGGRFGRIVEAAVGLCRAAGAEAWVGDRADVALASGAGVVQLPERGLSIEGARRVVGGRALVGRSVHSLEAAVAAVDADQLVVGTIFASATHPDVAPAGPGLLRAIRGALPSGGPPLYAIGGITPDRAPTAIEAGAAGIVAVGALWDAQRPAAAVAAFRAALGGAAGGD